MAATSASALAQNNQGTNITVQLPTFGVAIDASGVLLRRYRDRQAAIPGYAEDYAFLVFGLLELFQADADPSWNSTMRTTCVATMVDAGHAPNALPQRATANVNCRIFPDESVEQTRQVLVGVIAGAICCSFILRGLGDARRAMYITLSTAIVTACALIPAIVLTMI